MPEHRGECYAQGAPCGEECGPPEVYWPGWLRLAVFLLLVLSPWLVILALVLLARAL